ncbi:MAG: hypothetical protein JW862_04470 [Anaerolineales bacterium]|nr:hypothetical protein [Anaerolineales bacterium]
MSTFQLIIAFLLFAWQTAAAIWDFYDRRIPAWFSLVPLVCGLIYFGIMISPVAAVLLLVSVLGTNLPSRLGFVLTAVPGAYLVYSAYPEPQTALFAGWILLWVLWLAGVMGGADALAGTVLLVWFPFPLMLVALLTGLLLWSLGLLGFRYGVGAPLRIWIVIRQGWSKKLPHPQPGLGAFPLAMLIFLICQFCV